MKKKIVFISFVRLTDRVVRDWHIEFFIENNIEVEFWDIISLVRGDIQEFGSVNTSYLKVIESYEDFEFNIIANQPNDEVYYIMLISYSFRFSSVFKLLSRYDCKMIAIEQGMLPSYKSSLWEKVLNHLTHPFRFFYLIFNSIISSYYLKSNLVANYYLIFAAGNYFLSRELNAQKVVAVNLCDYDLYLSLKGNKNRLVQNKYAVFLDINLPFQTDLEILGMPRLNHVEYFKDLNKFFDLIEKKYQLEVVIAAHPTSNYDLSNFEFRKIFRLNTAELVRDSEFVITHHSTSISYAVLNYKPIVFVYTDEMKKIYNENVLKEIKAQSSYLNRSSHNISSIYNAEDIVFEDVNSILYDSYKYEFLTSLDSENKFSRDIMLNYFLD